MRDVFHFVFLHMATMKTDNILIKQGQNKGKAQAATESLTLRHLQQCKPIKQDLALLHLMIEGTAAKEALLYSYAVSPHGHHSQTQHSLMSAQGYPGQMDFWGSYLHLLRCTANTWTVQRVSTRILTSVT